MMDVLQSEFSKERRQNCAVNTARCAMQSKQDYHPWQRTRNPQRRPVESQQSRVSSGVPSAHDSRPVSVVTVRSACSSKCQHSWNVKKCVVPPINVEEEKRRRRHISDLKVLYAASPIEYLNPLKDSTPFCLRCTVLHSVINFGMPDKVKSFNMVTYGITFRVNYS
jgi:hypothetical protein